MANAVENIQPALPWIGVSDGFEIGVVDVGLVATADVGKGRLRGFEDGALVVADAGDERLKQDSPHPANSWTAASA